MELKSRLESRLKSRRILSISKILIKIRMMLIRMQVHLTGLKKM